LSKAEIERLLKAAKNGRYGDRDHLLMLMMYRHGLRVSEAIGLHRKDVDLDDRRLRTVLKGFGTTNKSNRP
jgi:integrase